MTRRVAVIVAGLLALSILAPAVTVAQDGGAATNQTTDGYTLDELREGGTTHAGAPPSMRFLGSYGSATIRHEPVGLGSASWEYIEPGRTTVKRNEVELKTIRLGDPDETLTVHAVAWQRGEQTLQTENGTITEPVPRNITERTVEVQLGRGYDNATVPLPPNYDSEQQITMWVEGYDGARWVFDHRSIATSQPISISTWGGFLNAIFWKIGVYAIPAMLVGWWGARKHREKAIVGPQWSTLQWLGLFAIPVAGLASVAAFQAAVLATSAPALLGLLFAPATYALVLESGNDKLEKFLFRHQDLETATSPRGEDTYDSRYVGHIVKQGVRKHDAGELILVEKGIMPFIARLRGNLATLDISDIETHKRARGPYALEIELDPDFEFHDALWHVPPRLERRSLVTRADLPGLGELEIPNPAVVLPLGGGAVGGWLILDAAMGIPTIGLFAGFVLGLPFVYHVEDGGAEAEPAPYHFTQAEASLAAETEQYADSKSLEGFREMAWNERMKNPMQAKEILDNFGETATERLLSEELGEMDMDDIREGDADVSGVAGDD